MSRQRCMCSHQQQWQNPTKPAAATALQRSQDKHEIAQRKHKQRTCRLSFRTPTGMAWHGMTAYPVRPMFDVIRCCIQ